jgi:hypothetical protein
MEKILRIRNKIFFLFYIIFLYKPDKSNKFNNHSNEIVVLGRGKSTNYYFKKFQNSPKIVALVNFMDHDMKNIDIKVLDEKEIYLFYNIEFKTLSPKYLLKLNIKGVIRTGNKDSRSYNLQTKFRKKFLDLFPEFPKHLDNYMSFKNSGLLSIVYMIDYFKPKKVYLFGFNFYHGDMIRDLSQGYTIDESTRTSSQKLTKNFQQLCNSFKTVKFYRYDDVEIDKLPNLIHINTKS